MNARQDENTPLLDENEAAAYLNVAVQTLRNWRWRRTGPRFVKLGLRTVRYRKSDLNDFIEPNVAAGSM